jgi:hypothetical protein
MLSSLKKVDKSFRNGLITGFLSFGLMVLLFSVATNYISLSDCEQIFIEGSGFSKKTYLKIQDENRVITGDEMTRMASAIPNGSFESNLTRIAIAASIYNDCLKED